MVAKDVEIGGGGEAGSELDEQVSEFDEEECESGGGEEKECGGEESGGEKDESEASEIGVGLETDGKSESEGVCWLLG